MSILKNLFTSKKRGSCCNVKIEEVKQQPISNCCGNNKEEAEPVVEK